MAKDSSFTLIELLIVIGILAVLATVAVLALNPLELIKQARDSTRMADLNTLNKALSVYQSSGQTNLGTPNTIYISIPSNQANCSDLGLPTSSPGWTYACVPSSTLRDSDGTGWIPVNFTSVSYGSPLEKLPIDPINATSTQNYYTYTPGGSWELTTEFESQKYLPKAINDGDSYPGVYSLRTSSVPLTPGIRDYGLVGYWKFDEGSGTTAHDMSGNGYDGTFTNSPSWTSGKINGALYFNGSSQYVSRALSGALINSLTVSFWVNASTISTSSWRDLVGIHGGSDKTRFHLSISNNSIIWYNVYGSSNNVGSSLIPAVGQWYYVAGTHNGTTAKVYVDGVQKGSGNYGASDTLENLLVGNSGELFDGKIDDVRIYNRALSAAEVAAIYNATK